MSVTVMMNESNSGTEGSKYVHGISCISMKIESSPREVCNGDRKFSVEEKLMVSKDRIRSSGEEKQLHNITCISSSTSSIGKNSDLSNKSMEKNSGYTEEEVQSSYKGCPFETMEALEEVLPMRRGISRFYNGKSKSFASLGDASNSVKDIAKPENAYSRRRRNRLACSLATGSGSWDKIRSSRSLKGNGGGFLKRVNISSSNRATLAMAVSMSNGNGGDNDNLSPLLPSCLTNAHVKKSFNSSLLMSQQHSFSALRSFSLADLQHCVSIITPKCTANTHLDIKSSHT